MEITMGQSWNWYISSLLSFHCPELNYRGKEHLEMLFRYVCAQGEKKKKKKGDQWVAGQYLLHQSWPILVMCYSYFLILKLVFIPLYLSFLDTPYTYIKVNDTSIYKGCYEGRVGFKKWPDSGQWGDFGCQGKKKKARQCSI